MRLKLEAGKTLEAFVGCTRIIHTGLCTRRNGVVVDARRIMVHFSLIETSNGRDDQQENVVEER